MIWCVLSTRHKEWNHCPVSLFYANSRSVLSSSKLLGPMSRTPHPATTSHSSPTVFVNERLAHTDCICNLINFNSVQSSHCVHFVFKTAGSNVPYSTSSNNVDCPCKRTAQNDCINHNQCHVNKSTNLMHCFLTFLSFYSLP